MHATLTELLAEDAPISEVSIRDRWHEQLHTDRSLHGEGWYVPPPHGMAVLIGSDTAPQRLSYVSLRAPGVWPRDDVFLNRDHGLLYAYASPVDRATGMIGDLALTLYFGTDEALHRHLAWALVLDQRLFAHAIIGMRLGDLATTAFDWITEAGLCNDIGTVNGSIGNNIGHTIPAADRGWSAGDMACISGPSWPIACAAIGDRRRYLRPGEDSIITPGMGITIEPRPFGSGLPMVSYHTIGLFHEDGRKQWLTDYDELFALAGMNMAVTTE